jgi:predicted dinucleotide-binding enzyme
MPFWGAILDTVFEPSLVTQMLVPSNATPPNEALDIKQPAFINQAHSIERRQDRRDGRSESRGVLTHLVGVRATIEDGHTRPDGKYRVMTRRIVIVGAGIVGMNLGVRMREVGNSVNYAGRNPNSEKVLASLRAVEGSTCVSLVEASNDADVVILALPFPAVAAMIHAIGDVGDTIVIDATNAIGKNRLEGDTTVLDLISAEHPEATLVKAFNTVGAESYLDPVIGGSSIFLPIAGDPGGTEVAREIAEEMGFDARVIGGRDQVRLVENFAEFCVYMSIKVGVGGGFGFELMER